ncbi:MAG: ABC transporter ATP-binding protein [Desulfovibrio sp.]
MSDEQLYNLTNVAKNFDGPNDQLEILTNVNFSVDEGQSVAILGASGSGKTTLLHILGTLDHATSGSVFFDGRDLGKLNGSEKAKIRNDEIGFVFQFHHLLPEFSTLENVALPAIIGGIAREEAYEMAKTALEAVEMSNRLEHKVTTLSGGERQRVSIARAILRKPRVVLADEPTGNLDAVTGGIVGELLMKLNSEHGMTLITVTHNNDLANLMEYRFELRSGELYAQV